MLLAENYSISYVTLANYPHLKLFYLFAKDLALSYVLWM